MLRLPASVFTFANAPTTRVLAWCPSQLSPAPSQLQSRAPRRLHQALRTRSVRESRGSEHRRCARGCAGTGGSGEGEERGGGGGGASEERAAGGARGRLEGRGAAGAEREASGGGAEGESAGRGEGAALAGGLCWRATRGLRGA
eukprot:1437198-Rhodomonas_salina.2